MKQAKENLENEAKRILSSVNSRQIPVDLQRIAAQYGIDVENTGELDRTTSGRISYVPESNSFHILLNERENEHRRRFTLAHELAHFFLHKDKIIERKAISEDGLFRNTYLRKRDKDEADANYLASAILMDKDLMQYAVDKELTQEDISQVFNVSPQAVSIRLKELGLRACA